METSASSYDQEACIRVAFPLTSGIKGLPPHHYYLAKITETNKNGQSKQHYHYFLIV